MSKLARFTNRVVSLAKKAVDGTPVPAVQKGGGGYADWVVVALHGLREYLGHSYRQLLDVLSEMPRIVAKLNLAVAELPDFTTVCARMKDLDRVETITADRGYDWDELRRNLKEHGVRPVIKHRGFSSLDAALNR